MQKLSPSRRPIDGFLVDRKSEASKATEAGKIHETDAKTGTSPIIEGSKKAGEEKNSAPARRIPVYFIANHAAIITITFMSAQVIKTDPHLTKTAPQPAKSVTRIPVKEPQEELANPGLEASLPQEAQRAEANGATPSTPEADEGTQPAPEAESNEAIPLALETPPPQKSQKTTAKPQKTTAKAPKSTQIHQKSAKKTKTAPDPVTKARRRRITPQKVVMFLAGVTIVACLSVLAIWLFDGFQAQQDYQQVADTSTETTGNGDQATDQRINFDELKATNPDTVAWLRVPNTTINYPVVQTTDNATYLSKTFTGGYSLSGTIFLDKGNAADFSSVNSILYGHNRVDGTMFADLDKIYDGSLGNDIKIFLYLPDGTVRTYRVFSSYVTANDPTSINPSVTDFNSFAGEMLARSERDFNLDPLAVTVRDNTRKDDDTAQDSTTADSAPGNTAATNTTDSTPAPSVLTLSTCVANDDRRYLFHAILIQVDNF